MRILRVITSVDPRRGGPIEGLVQISRALVQQGHSVEVASLDDPASDCVKQFSFPLHALGPGFSSYQYSSQFESWAKSHAKNYDCAIIHGLWQFTGRGAFKAFIEAKVPYFVFPHGMLDPWFKKTHPLKHFKKLFYWILFERHILSSANAVFFTSEEERSLAADTFPFYKAQEAVVHYGTSEPKGNIDELRSIFLKRFIHAKNKKCVLFLGRIHPKKGCDLLIRAFAESARKDPESHLIMAGPDELGWTAELQAEAEKLGVADQITWTGMLQGDEKWGAFHASKVFILPSHQENFGVAVAEALACGLPVLITKKVNIWREITRDGAGFAEEDSLEGITRLLTQWQGVSADNIEGMRKQAKACFNAHFEVTRAAKNLVELMLKYKMKKDRNA